MSKQLTFKERILIAAIKRFKHSRRRSDLALRARLKARLNGQTIDKSTQAVID